MRTKLGAWMMTATMRAMTPRAMKRGFIFWEDWLGSDMDFPLDRIFDRAFFSTQNG
jgi:hypothetical protein